MRFHDASLGLSRLKNSCHRLWFSDFSTHDLLFVSGVCLELRIETRVFNFKKQLHSQHEVVSRASQEQERSHAQQPPVELLDVYVCHPAVKIVSKLYEHVEVEEKSSDQF